MRLLTLARSSAKVATRAGQIRPSVRHYWNHRYYDPCYEMGKQQFFWVWFIHFVSIGGPCWLLWYIVTNAQSFPGRWDDMPPEGFVKEWHGLRARARLTQTQKVNEKLAQKKAEWENELANLQACVAKQ
eukprot:NODE_1158_length_592_cov_190.051565_g1084_i0.p1 GENE.NODE_1158_length_592_cov_190.051565_g1084_i0~~NODE_1158_length_592_cov_190.051565_g1084_i0.p1  ORF type:complete len:129 (+),score=17.07 NODE_1158_length_592_cov_190.051565_g1084_i0:61-447(+)